MPTVVFAGLDDPIVEPADYRGAARMFDGDYIVEEVPRRAFHAPRAPRRVRGADPRSPVTGLSVADARGPVAGCYRAWPMPEMDRRTLMLMTGFGVLAAAAPLPQARAYPRPPAAPQGGYIFQDEFDGPAGSAPDSSKWAVAKAREVIKDPTHWELPENIGQYRDDRRNVFVDGKSNLVLRAAKDGPTFYSGKIQSLWRGGVGHTWEARIKLDCLTAGSLARLLAGQ